MKQHIAILIFLLTTYFHYYWIILWWTRRFGPLSWHIRAISWCCSWALSLFKELLHFSITSSTQKWNHKLLKH